MINFEKHVRSLCTPAQICFFISMISILGMLSQNVMNSTVYKIGLYSTQTSFKNIWFFTFKILGVLFWTFILNFMCNAGFKDVAWFFVLLPILIMFIVIGAFVLVFIGRESALQQQSVHIISNNPNVKRNN